MGKPGGQSWEALDVLFWSLSGKSKIIQDLFCLTLRDSVEPFSVTHTHTHNFRPCLPIIAQWSPCIHVFLFVLALAVHKSLKMIVSIFRTSYAFENECCFGIFFTGLTEVDIFIQNTTPKVTPSKCYVHFKQAKALSSCECHSAGPILSSSLMCSQS